MIDPEIETYPGVRSVPQPTIEDKVDFYLPYIRMGGASLPDYDQTSVGFILAECGIELESEQLSMLFRSPRHQARFVRQIAKFYPEAS